MTWNLSTKLSRIFSLRPMDVQPAAVSYWSLETIAVSSEKRRRKVEFHSPPQPEKKNWVYYETAERHGCI